MNKILCGDALEQLKTIPSESVDMCVTSPPYYALRDYGTGHWEGGDPNCDHQAAIYSRPNLTPRKQTTSVGTLIEKHKKVCTACGAVYIDDQIGLEDTPEAYIQKLVDVFHEVRRVLKSDGTLWVNIGDSYCNSNGYARASAEYQRPGRNDAPANDRDLTHLHSIGYKTKDLIGIPWLLAFALRADGWYLRQDIIWAKPNPMPESITDRCTKSHEYIFLFSKSPKYYFDYKAIQEKSKWADDKRKDQGRIAYEGKRTNGGTEHGAQQSFVTITESRRRSVWEANEEETTVPIRFGGSKYGDNDDPHYATKSGNEWQPQTADNGEMLRNKRDVWQVSTQAITEAHFATFPEKLIEPCILAGSRRGGVVLDPFFGSGTTGRVATAHSREYIGIELNPEYIEIANKRLSEVQMQLF